MTKRRLTLDERERTDLKRREYSANYHTRRKPRDSLSKLNDELLWLILSNLSSQELLACQCVSRRLNKLSNDNQVQEKIRSIINSDLILSSFGKSSILFGLSMKEIHIQAPGSSQDTWIIRVNRERRICHHKIGRRPIEFEIIGQKGNAQSRRSEPRPMT